MRRMLTPRYVTVLIYVLLFVNLSYTHDSSVHRKPSSADPSKKIAQPALSSYATPIAFSAGVTGSTMLSIADAWDFYRWTAEFLEGLKNREANQKGNPFTSSSFLSFDLFG
jgi:hypothetical protein